MIVLAALASASPIVRSEFVFEKAPFRSCHASTIAQTPGGFVAAWFGGDHEGAKDVAIYAARLDGSGWSAPRKVATDEEGPCWNPVLFQPASGPLMLFYKVGPHPAEWRGRLALSSDGGRTFPDSRSLPAGILGPIKDKPIVLPDGTLLCPSSDETGERYRIHMERTGDGGRTWTRTPDLNDPDRIAAIQPSLLPLGDGRIRAVGRTSSARMFAIDSSDEGRTWGPMRLTDVRNPNSGIDAVRLADGRFLLVYNDTTDGRTPLDVAVSRDAEHWSNALALETEPGEYSYPAVIQAKDGLVHVVYTWRRVRIRHVVIDPNRL